MRTLRLVGLSADGRSVVFVDDAGAEYGAPADERLRAALRGDRARLGQLEIEMDSALRPRDIQARIRAGDSPETVAAAAQVPVERIMGYCLPVLAEREHIAELAQRCHVRAPGGEGPSRRLSEVVVERLRGRGVDPSSAQWDAWRREDGRWSVRTKYLSGESEHSALFVFDQAGRYSLADDDEARWLTGEKQSTRKGPMPREGGHPGERRLSAVPSGDDLLSLEDRSDDEPFSAGDEDFADEEAATSEDLEPVEAEGSAAGGSVGAGQDDASDGPETPPDDTDDLTAVVRALEPPDDDAPAAPGVRPQDAPTEPTPGRKRKQRRASVPSWDEIMFGRDDS